MHYRDKIRDKKLLQKKKEKKMEIYKRGQIK